MIDPHPLLRALQGPPPPEAPPPWPGAVSRRGHAVLLALAALLLAAPVAAWRLRPAAEGWTLRGPAAAPEVDLRLAVQQGATVERVRARHRYRVGDRGFFQVAASAPGEVEVWVERAGQRTTMGHIQAGPAPTDLRSEDGLIAYGLEAPGRTRFCAASLGAPPTCLDLEAE